MEKMKLRFTNAVAAKLVGAPHSTAKAELIEELSDNLYRRFLEMNGAGVPEDEAFRRALDDLGDVDELLAYLGVEPNPDANILIDPDGSRVTVQGKDGGTHYNYDPNSSQNDLDAILANMGEICRTAMGQVKEAAKQAKDAIQRRTNVEKDKGRVKVHFNTHPDAPPPPPPQDGPARHAPPPPPSHEPPPPHGGPGHDAPPPPHRGTGWEFEAELDSDEGRFFAGAGPREKKDVVYGFGYDKDKGGFFAQWGEYQGGQSRGPRFTGTDSRMEHQDDGSYSVTALKDLRGIEVFTAAGDVTIHVSEAPDAGVIIDGDVDDLDVTCSADGVLAIREGRTASSSFFSRRGFGSADVELYLPARHWETISATTASGDVEIGREDGLDVEYLTISTANGDANCRLTACHVLSFKSASGDLELAGVCDDLVAETMSGDIDLQGQVQSARLKTASGDIELRGAAERLRAAAISGDVEVATSVLPEAMDLSSKSGDCSARIPDAGPFSVRMKTVSGEMGCAFPVNYTNGMCVYGDGSGPVYSMTSVSGSVELGRY